MGRPDIHSFVGDIDSILGCFVVEAKDRNVTLGDCIPQVVTQLYAVAKKLKYTFLFDWYSWLIFEQENTPSYAQRIRGSFRPCPAVLPTSLHMETICVAHCNTGRRRFSPSWMSPSSLSLLVAVSGTNHPFHLPVRAPTHHSTH